MVWVYPCKSAFGASWCTVGCTTSFTTPGDERTPPSSTTIGTHAHSHAHVDAAAGRKELLRCIGRRRDKEMPEAQILGHPATAASKGGGRGAGAGGGLCGGIKLRTCSLGTAYILRDLLGRGDLQRVRTPAGAFICCRAA